MTDAGVGGINDIRRARGSIIISLFDGAKFCGSQLDSIKIAAVPHLCPPFKLLQIYSASTVENDPLALES